MDVAEQVRRLRDLARTARRLAISVSNGDRRQLLEHAEELEQQASVLEQRGTDQAMPPPAVVQVQMQLQQQQQHEAGPPVESEKPEPKDPT